MQAIYNGQYFIRDRQTIIFFSKRFEKKFEDTNGVIRNRQSETDGQNYTITKTEKKEKQ